jgi:hypothetical protein
MTIGRGIGIGVLVLIVAVIGAVFYILSSLDSIVAAAIENVGSQVTGTSVQVSSVNIDLKSGQGAINELRVANPDGFSAPDIFSLGGISTKINLSSIGQDPIIIDEIIIKSPQVVYEINKSGKSNIAALEDNIAKSKGAGGAKTESETGGGPGLVIRKLVIDSGQIDAKVAALPNKDLSAKLARIELTNVGADKGGASATQIAQTVTSALIKGVGPAVANLGLNQYLGKSLDQVKNLEGDVKQEAAKSLDEAAEKGKEKLKGLLGK